MRGEGETWKMEGGGGENVQITLNVFFIPVRFSGCVQRVCPSVCAHIFQQPNLLLASLLFGPLLPSKPLSQGRLLLSKVVKHENETLIYLTFSAVQMSHWVLMHHALHMFLIGTFEARLAYTFGVNTQEVIRAEQYTCTNLLMCKHVSIHYICLVRFGSDVNILDVICSF